MGVAQEPEVGGTDLIAFEHVAVRIGKQHNGMCATAFDSQKYRPGQFLWTACHWREYSPTNPFFQNNIHYSHGRIQESPVDVGVDNYGQIALSNGRSEVNFQA